MTEKKKIPEGAIRLTSRGIGTDLVGCFCCSSNKSRSSYNNNISAFVKSKEDGRKAEWMFYCGRGAYVDYRENEPNYIQLKIGGCDKHLSNLQLLNEEINKYGYINEDMIRRCIDPKIDKLCDILIDTAKSLKNSIMFNRSVSFHKIRMDESILQNYNTLKQSLYNIITTIYNDKLDDEADRFKWVDLNCGCEKPFFQTKNRYDNRVSDVICKNCGVRFWYNGTWVKKTDEGWEIVWK